MEFDKIPSRPVVKSAISAIDEWERWLYENHFRKLVDGDGLDWLLEMKVDELPADHQIHGGKMVITMQLGVDVGAEEFIRTGTLDPVEDERLLALIGSRLVPLRMRPVTHEAKDLNAGRELLSRVLPELRENTKKSRLREIKRGLIGRWIDELSAFGNRENLGDW